MFYISTHELLDTLIKLGMAFFVGGIVGAEREYKNKTVGFRTLILICIGAMLFTVLALKMSPTDSTRIIANIVVGIGFLGAGVIFKENTKIAGMTTAATIWATAALGVSIGLGYYALSIIFTISIIIVLLLFSRIELYIDKNHLIKSYEIRSYLDKNFIVFIEQQIKDSKLKIDSKFMNKENEKIVFICKLVGTPIEHQMLADKLLYADNILSFRCW